MARPVLLLAFALAFLSVSSLASGSTVEHTLIIKNLTVRRLCNEQVITAVNGSLPGPVIKVREGDTLVVHVLNRSPYNMTIHWHGILQLLSGWADGPEYVTQCPILPGQSYTYRFPVVQQEGTLWWHAHSSVLRATIYGALLIRPRSGHSYPFPKPAREFPILLGEWWNANVFDVEEEGLATGIGPNISDAYTINGLPGDLYPCSEERRTYELIVKQGKTYMLRIINAALNAQLFFKISNHNMTVVAIDATYTNPYETDVVVVGPGQTTDVLLKTDQPVGSYYMAARPYGSAPAVPINNSTTRGIIVYEGSTSSTPIMPNLPPINDTPTAHKFFSNITGLVGGPHWIPVPKNVDEHMFVTFGLGLRRCPPNAPNETCQGLLDQRNAASMNNHSFVFPIRLSMLEAFFSNVDGVYTRDFPDEPAIKFDYTNTSISFDESLIFTKETTSVKRVKFNATIEMVLQNTALITPENHPIHIHGFNFHVLAQGFGNYDPETDSQMFNLVNPQMRNTIGVPTGGWAVIRFQANNPGVWLVHCHIDAHLPWGLAMAFEVENGGTPDSTLPPPPADLPKC